MMRPLLAALLVLATFTVAQADEVPSRPTPLPTASNSMHVTVREGGECSIPIEDELNTIIGWTTASLDGATGTIVGQYDHTVFVRPDPDQAVTNACLDGDDNWRLDVSQLVECIAVEDAFGQLRSHCGPDAPAYAPGPVNYCWPRVCATPADAERLVAGERACEEGKIAGPCYLNDFQPRDGN